ncbi:flagellar brake protein [Halanaerobacter jeridensis]|uniref:C-di-GMP-binding flagellar brake protein YcgR n=1 Tax=Halanaerobacter jeridensis TaxID=706427 RepID=A0A938XQL7_9FIRM|nr:PilZ domain-containing protein [Halanaerobacter jeridensis]MBM7555809.1 c-di-GMP-binding flagellar brake protein YcgR [Halanaerobacter jeridensis]
MHQNKISSGQKVTIGKDYNNNTNLYRVRVLAVYKKMIELELPKKDGQKPDIIEQGELLTISFAGQAGLNRLDVKVKRVKEYRKKFIVTRKSKIRRIQRRKYVRLPLRKEIEYQRIINIEDNFLSAMMLDISASGLKIRLEELNGVAMYQVLDLKLNNLSCGINLLKGRVVRLDEKEDPDPKKPFYDLGVEFIDISVTEQEKLIEWVLFKQRQLRQKGVL